jgi:hypothetical protein
MAFSHARVLALGLALAAAAVSAQSLETFVGSDRIEFVRDGAVQSSVQDKNWAVRARLAEERAACR